MTYFCYSRDPDGTLLDSDGGGVGGISFVVDKPIVKSFLDLETKDGSQGRGNFLRQKSRSKTTKIGNGDLPLTSN